MSSPAISARRLRPAERSEMAGNISAFTPVFAGFRPGHDPPCAVFVCHRPAPFVAKNPDYQRISIVLYNGTVQKLEQILILGLGGPKRREPPGPESTLDVRHARRVRLRPLRGRQERSFGRGAAYPGRGGAVSGRFP